MNLYDSLLNKREKLSIIGLGYVGLVLAIAFAKKVDVIGFDINLKKINKYINGIDSTNEVGTAALSSTTMTFTSDERDLKKAKFHIIAVPTPINSDKIADLSLVINASQTLGRYLSQGSVIVYESTVFPGVTENICIPSLEKESGLICGVDFKKLSLEALKQYYRKNPLSSPSMPILIDVKSLFDKEQAKDLGYLYWRL